MRYMIILLDDAATSFCHYHNPKTVKRPMSHDDLKAGILFAMKQNLTVQLVYPSFDIPEPHRELIETTYHVKIMPANAAHAASADVLVFNTLSEFSTMKIEDNPGKVFILRTNRQDLFNRDHPEHLTQNLVHHSGRLNIILTDVDACTDADFDAYREWLSVLCAQVAEACRSGKSPDVNILHDRIAFEKMNNCNAGHESVTLAPNGKFYVCPAFYLDSEEDSTGAPQTGIELKNQQLYRLEYAPLCRMCDAYHCKRCVWMNRKTTLEVNTPSRQQCVAAHLERGASKNLLNELKPEGYFSGADIPSIDYLDPFDAVNQLIRQSKIKN